MKCRAIGSISILLLALVLATSAPVLAEEPSGGKMPTPPPDREWTVLDFGAKGDGATDDTAAFQKALDARAQLGGIVRVPPGQYRIASHLVVPKMVSLVGDWQAPPANNPFIEPPEPTVPDLAGSVLLAEENAGDPDGAPFIALKDNATLRGMTVFYPNQTNTNPPVAYPWTVSAAGYNVSVVNCLLINPYMAIDVGTNDSTRHFVSGVYADALYRGIYIDQCWDVGRIENVHFWPFWIVGGGPAREFVKANAIAIEVGRTDWGMVSNTFSFGYHIGIRFIASRTKTPHGGGGNIMFSQSGSDMADFALLVDEVQGHSGITFSNCQMFGDIVVGENNMGPVRFTGTGFYGSLNGENGVMQALLEGQGRVAFDNCHFITLHPDGKADTAILARSGSLSVQNCEFMTPSEQQILLEPGVRNAVVIGNEFRGRATIDNRSTGNVAIMANVDDVLPEEADALTIDASDTEKVRVEGPWTRAQGVGHYRADCLYTPPGSAETRVVWEVQLPESGRYEVFTWHGPDPSNDHAHDAPYEVHHADGMKELRMDQTIRKGGWTTLGVYPFSTDKPARIVVRADADRNVVADAIRFVAVEEDAE